MFWFTNKAVITRQYDTKGNYASVLYIYIYIYIYICVCVCVCVCVCDTQVEISTQIIPKLYKL